MRDTPFGTRSFASAMTSASAALLSVILSWTLAAPPAPAAAQQRADPADFATGAPADPSETWSIAAGGRLYDSWWLALGKDAPKSRNPAYPSTGKASNANTWRCKECHGWDYRGRDGNYQAGDHATGIIGIRGAQGKPVADLARMLRAAPHGYASDMLDDADIARLALFVSRGQHDTTGALKGTPARSTGDAVRGKGVYQTTCAACHGFDGRLLNWGSAAKPEYIGTSANLFPDEFLHKVRNSNPGSPMISLRAFAMQDAIDVLAYAQTLPDR